HGHRVDGFLAQFIGQLAQLLFRQTAQVIGGDDLVQKGGLGERVHAYFSPFDSPLWALRWPPRRARPLRSGQTTGPDVRPRPATSLSARPVRRWASTLGQYAS